MKLLTIATLLIALAICVGVYAPAQTMSLAVISSTYNVEHLDNAILAHFLFDAPLPAGRLDNGRCSICKRLDWKSTVMMWGGTACTLAYCGSGYYDTGGTFVAPTPCNTCSSSGQCSNGHTIMEMFRSL